MTPFGRGAKPRRGQRASATEVIDRPLDDRLVGARELASMQQADCCVARAAFRVALPPNDVRQDWSELYFCGHHYQDAHAGLMRTKAVVHGIRLGRPRESIVG